MKPVNGMFDSLPLREKMRCEKPIRGAPAPAVCINLASVEDSLLLNNELMRVIAHLVAAIQASAADGEPFHHLKLSSVFPSSLYEAMLAGMPGAEDYRPMSGRTAYTRLEGGSGTRTKMDLFPEFIRHLPRAKRPVWRVVGRALCSPEVREAFRERLAPGLAQRFGSRYRSIRMYPIPILTRDVPGYEIGIHPDTRSKAMTVQLYLPADRSIEHVGTVFHKRTGENAYERSLQMPFAPNSGYAFAVGTDTYHSVDKVGPEARARDSILLTYFLDETALERTKNRVKRFANLLRNEFRRL